MSEEKPGQWKQVALWSSLIYCLLHMFACGSSTEPAVQKWGAVDTLTIPPNGRAGLTSRCDQLILVNQSDEPITLIWRRL